MLISGLALLGAGFCVGAERGIEITLAPGDVALSFGTSAAAGALFALLGLGLGALVRNQTAAAVSAPAWFFVAEEALTLMIGSEPARWLPGEVTGRLTGAVALSGAAGAFLLLAAYFGAVVLAGTAALWRRELA